MLQFGGRLDLTEEPVAHAGPLDQLPADDLEHFQSPHELVPGEVDHPHPAAPQLADDLVVGVVDQLGRKGVDRWRRNDGAAAPSVADTPNGGQSAADLSDLTWAFCNRPRNSSDDSSATRRWQESQSSRCLLTVPAEVSSSLPRRRHSRSGRSGGRRL